MASSLGHRGLSSPQVCLSTCASRAVDRSLKAVKGRRAATSKSNVSLPVTGPLHIIRIV
jgi:hypothetical protein